MPDDPKAQDSLTPAVKDRSVAQGDVPAALKRRYYTDERGGDGLGFYVDARIPAPAFRDRGRELVAARLDPGAVRDMTAIAQHRGWSIVKAQGSAGFRREAWLAGRSSGLEVRGYRPTERDLQELQRRQDRRRLAEDRNEVQEERRDDRRNRAADQREVRRERREDSGVKDRMDVVEAVVRSRVVGADRQERILAAARERTASWLERGARFKPLGVRRAPEPAVEPARTPERSRGR